MKEIRIGQIGTGFMGRTHSNAYLQVPRFFNTGYKPVLKCVCSLDKTLPEYASNWGYESMETDWRKVIARDDIDLIDIVVPNNLHHDIVIAAAEAGKMVVCEKPLAMNMQQAEEMVAAVEKAGVANLVSFNYRRVPAVTLAKQLIEENRIGRPFHYNATYDQDYTISANVPQGGASLWRLDSKVAGSGVTGDLLAHSIDLAEWLNGPITRVTAKTEIFIKERMHLETGKMMPVTIDDACMFLAVFQNGSIGTFRSTRYARGRKNYQTFELNGENGAVYFDLEVPHSLQFFRYRDPETGEKTPDHVVGWQSIHVTHSEHPYMNHYWVPGTTIGYEHTFINAFADFLNSLSGGPKFQPDMRAAMRVQYVCDKVLESARTEQWVDL
ncbi:MAG: Gfo/Idh/MocA family oxidoreductase [Planctomycetia bacterium]|nr:Gfo/Idh/MocA family oxidoreductase [Planctomycetia bacterium]